MSQLLPTPADRWPWSQSRTMRSSASPSLLRWQSMDISSITNTWAGVARCSRRRVGWGRRAGGERGRGQVCRILLLLSCRVLPARGSGVTRRQPLPHPVIHRQCSDLPLPVAYPFVLASARYVICSALLLPILSTWLM
jgi:hypothetical protein